MLLLLLSRFSRVRLCATTQTAAHQAPPSLGFSGKNTGVGCHFLLQCMKVKSESEVAQSCLTLGDPMDCNLPGSSVHGIFQARILEWGAIAFSFHDLWNALKAKSHNCGIATAMLTLLYLPPFTLITISHYLFPMAHLYKFLCLTAAYLIRVTPIILRKK